MKRFEILIENRERSRLSLSRLRSGVQKILQAAGWKRAGLSLVLVDDSKMRALHRQFLGKNRTTDVLAFGQIEGKTFPRKGVPFLGDVVVSVERAKKVGPRFGNRWDEELLFYICHGILHLLGERDRTPRERAHMLEKQETLLQKALGPRWRSKKQKRLF